MQPFKWIVPCAGGPGEKGGGTQLDWAARQQLSNSSVVYPLLCGVWELTIRSVIGRKTQMVSLFFFLKEHSELGSSVGRALVKLSISFPLLLPHSLPPSHTHPLSLCLSHPPFFIPLYIHLFVLGKRTPTSAEGGWLKAHKGKTFQLWEQTLQRTEAQPSDRLNTKRGGQENYNWAVARAQWSFTYLIKNRCEDYISVYLLAQQTNATDVKSYLYNCEIPSHTQKVTQNRVETLFIITWNKLDTAEPSRFGICLWRFISHASKHPAACTNLRQMSDGSLRCCHPTPRWKWLSAHWYSHNGRERQTNTASVQDGWVNKTRNLLAALPHTAQCLSPYGAAHHISFMIKVWWLASNTWDEKMRLTGSSPKDSWAGPHGYLNQI